MSRIDRILGVTIVGEPAGDMLAGAKKYVADEWKRAHALQKIQAWLARDHDLRRA
ncbi:MAG: hypothetical protein KJ614_12795 [Gammaproteobacteria bacterium]|uniref:hypothetical protein n=1 Tax=Rhodoferax sp. TaxID=50421 RepID=UPI001D914D16|nr:hypothetical protein [Rhodoferax sp.]MBU3899783.1 hypothetical protein [Gammaproteobacteria bacterium]MBU3997049.1 hypothetical protein [Gammaproteobacteria bacterium]MBU4019047.1 hypothetical protein [Gammaproteobacteria bacterium]MBU4078766.1 hypothetical protein [Gammaproteobacteria bacterium]MBU4114842.1 hypothetical protein [Gammaproteobacteria bacterium]